ncbi:MAG: hypothetical protein AB8G96_14050 [Phycisphaerales bacterium]
MQIRPPIQSAVARPVLAGRDASVREPRGGQRRRSARAALTTGALLLGLGFAGLGLGGCTETLTPATRATIRPGGALVTHRLAGPGFAFDRNDPQLGYPADRGISRRSISVTDTWRRLGTDGRRVRESGGDRVRERTITITGN